MAIRCATDGKLDLLTIDGSGGGTGMSPWNMMEHWGVPSLPLHIKAYEYTKLLADRGVAVTDLSFAGGFAREDHIFKALALGSPFVKLVCMGRAPMIPAFVGSNIEGVLRPDRRVDRQRPLGRIARHREDASATSRRKSSRPGKPFWKRSAPAEMKNIPFGAVAMYAYADKLACGLQQFMAGARASNISEFSRADLMSANRETAHETGIPYLTEAEHDKAMAVLTS